MGLRGKTFVEGEINGRRANTSGRWNGDKNVWEGPGI